MTERVGLSIVIQVVFSDKVTKQQKFCFFFSPQTFFDADENSIRKKVGKVL